jgi:hypothetical protein
MFDVFGGLAFGIITVLMFLLLPMALVAVAVPYAVLRMRDVKGDHHDPQLGLKVAYAFFFSLGVLMVQLGLTINVADLIVDDNKAPAAAGPQLGPGLMPVQPVRANRADGRLLTPAMRTGWAVASSGLVFAAVFGLATTLGTNVRRFPAVRRLFVGWRLMVAGLAVVAAVTTLLIWLFQKDPPDNKAYEVALATLAVWAPSLAVHVFLMQQYAKTEYYVPPFTKTSTRKVEAEEDDADDE